MYIRLAFSLFERSGRFGIPEMTMPFNPPVFEPDTRLGETRDATVLPHHFHTQFGSEKGPL